MNITNINSSWLLNLIPNPCFYQIFFILLNLYKKKMKNIMQHKYTLLILY